MEEQITRAGEAELGPGMLGCDREVFAQVWDRVAPGGSSTVEVAPKAQVEPAATAEPVSLGEDDREGRRLQELTRRALSDASIYRELTRRSRRARLELNELAGRKTRQAKRLSAAYFLMTGVRYWPRETTPVNPPESFFPILRQQFLAEGEQAKALRQAAQEAEEPMLGELYLSLAEEADELVYTIRLIVERET